MSDLQDDLDWRQVEWWGLDALNPYPDNTKDHPPEQVTKLAKAIKKFGWDVPIVVDETGVILKGHGRRLAAIELNLAQVPVIVRRGLSEDEKRALRIADNKLAESDWIDSILAAELQALDAADFDLELTGFSDEEFQRLIGELNGGEGEGGGGDEGGGSSPGSLSEKFLIPPFSVLDARQGYWQKRKQQWLAIGIQSELGRGEGMTWGESEEITSPGLNYYRDKNQGKNEQATTDEREPRRGKGRQARVTD